MTKTRNLKKQNNNNVLYNDNSNIPDVEFVDPSSDEDNNEYLQTSGDSVKTTTELNSQNIQQDEGNDIRAINVPIKEISTNTLRIEKEDNNSLPEQQKILNNSIETNNSNFGEVIEITNVEVVQKPVTKLGHEMFLRIMENDLLRDVKVELQNNKMVQEEIRKKVEAIYEIKEKGEKILLKEKEDGYKYIQSLEYIKDGKFDDIGWIYPVVLDQKVIYALRCEQKKLKQIDDYELEYSVDENEDDTDETQAGEVPYGDKMENQLLQLKEMKSLFTKRAKGEINIVSFYSGLNKQQESYKPPPDTFWNDDNIPKAKKLKLTEYAELYRYINISNKKIKNRIGKGPTVIPLTLPEKKEKVESFIENTIIERKSLTIDSGETVYIVGFLFIPNLKEKNEIEIELSIKEALDRKIILNNNKTNIELDKSCIVLFENAVDQHDNLVTSEEYVKMLQVIIPTSENVTDLIIKNNKELDIYEYDKKLKKWGYNIRTITNDAWKKAREVLSKNAVLPFPKTITGVKIEDIGKVCKIEGDELLSDSQYYSKLMRSVYNQDLSYTSDVSKYFRGKNCQVQRINVLFETYDNGSFYYTYSFFNIKDSVEKNKSQLKRLQKLKTKLLSEAEALKKMSKNKSNTDNISVNISNESFDILKIKEQFDKLDKIPLKVFNSKQKLKVIENLIDQINKNITTYDTRHAELKKLLRKEAELIILHYMGNITSKLDKNRISEAQLGKIMYEKELKRVNLDNSDENMTQVDVNNSEKPKDFLLTISEETPNALKSIISQVNQSGSYSNKKQLLYSIIQLDGIIVNKYIYSIFYGKPLICGHWYYLLMIDNSDTETERNKWVTLLLSMYGDDGSSSKGEETCIMCGSFLDRTNLVESMYINQWGMPLKIEEAYEDKERTIFYRHSLPLNPYDVITENIKKCNSDEFKTMLKKRKIIEKPDIDKALLACKLIVGMMAKIDINIPSRHFIELVLQCVKESKKIPSFETYYIEKIQEIKIQRKLSADRAKNLEYNQKITDKLQISYVGYFMVRYGTLVLAHLLWYLRTSVPQYIPGNNATTTTMCSFFGFDGDNGFDYFMCIVVEMKILMINITIEEKVINEVIPKHKIVKNFRFWINSLEPNYKNALLRKNNYVKDDELFHIRTGNNRIDRVTNPFDWADEKSVGKIKELESSDVIMKKMTDVLKGSNPDDYNALYNDIIFEIRKRVFKIRNFLNNFINNAPVAQFNLKDIEVSCCEQLNEDNIKYIDYFANIDEKIVTLSNENIRLQERYDILNNFLIPTTFMISSNKAILNNSKNKKSLIMSKIPFNVLDVPDNFIKMAYNIYCHDGVTLGEYHSFENQDFPNITRCIKCGWFLNKLNETVFGREEFVNLMDIVDKRKLIDYTSIVTKRTRLDVQALKRKSPADKLKEDIGKLAKRISRLLKVKEQEKRTGIEKGNEKEILNNIQNFLYNIDDFKNFILDPDSSASDKEIVQTIHRRNKFAIQKMKEYINEYLRKNISRIKWGFKTKTNINTSWIPKRYEEKWQRIFVDKNAWLEQFLTKQNEKLFKKFKFHFTIENINSIVGIQSIYGSYYKSLIRTSTFDLNDALRVLKHYMVKEMLLFLDLAGPGEPILADFYVKLFNEIEKDRNIINLSNKEITKWTDTIQEDNTIVRVRYFDALKEEESLFNAPYKKFTDDIYSDPIFNPKLVTNEDVEEEIEESEKIEQEENLKDQAVTELGNDATDQLVEDFVRDAMEEDFIEKEVTEEVYDNEIQKEGEDVMDSGYDYGDPQQGIEDEGNGIDDYSMNEIWEPVHEPDVEEGDEVSD